MAADRFVRNKLKDFISIPKIITIIYYKLPKNFMFAGEQHDFWEFIYVDKGELLITAGSSGYRLKAGELAFHRPDEFHDVRADGTIAPNVIVVSFECRSSCMKYFENKILFLDDHEKQLLSQVVAEGQNAFEMLSQQALVYGMCKRKTAPPGAEQLVRSGLEQMLISLFRRRDSILKRQRQTPTTLSNQYQKLAAEIGLYMETHLDRRIRLETMSNELGISISLLKRIFKLKYHCSPADYIQGLKIEEAKRLIREDALNFTQIADHLGFYSSAHFCRVFRQKTDMTPTEYARSVKV